MIYLDNAATSWPKAPGTAEVLSNAILSPLGNPGRTSHSAGISADRIIFELRESLAHLFGIGDSSLVALTPGCTSALNTILSGFLKKGQKVLCSSMEHNSVMRPLMQLQQERQLQINRIPSEPESGYPDLKAFEKLLDEKPDLLVLTAASNVNGIIFPLEQMCLTARKKGIPLCVDAAQAAGEIPLYPENWGIDFLCFAGHKGLLGPAGCGGFYIRDPERVRPLILGGTGSRSREEIQPEIMPDRFESGTANIPGFAGLLHSLNFLQSSKTLYRAAEERCGRLCRRLHELEGYRIIGRSKDRDYTRVFSILPEKGNLTELTAFLNSKDIAVRSGLHCAPSAHRVLGSFESGGTLRLSPGLFTTNREIELLIESLKEYRWLTLKN
ncbi:MULTISPECIES: aminotransferase class V-fold PLP-dependent enzyme [unclassified Oceanispirochaeta]|uniref:aminotransferase class V-fold PLP-dependent enzyme n=1 Tax=unclassified Oceanispirochaeta TaxID=2635722 RepID=UPI000E09BA36|nr:MULTISPECIES: aminotransferase class V-fold PLP-dependent enzyme [unclassified Oceanispirochaeta]MBF9015301.1 aminotransferase class V-fold PLP-dependent enzyme [Oceanispirochaeta sp. M2]NPD71759.1 aminotransferase class V-fold PLP-dependent enzyme [Oceanispirochaeta sp. M1]RDG32951.1 aminotransferase class V-fold PLP-dependent enzyme [Oceanispirochaeta sp. M1]